VERRLEPGTLFALLFVAALIASMFWMASTGNRFCCDDDSLFGRLRDELFVEAP
jgi:hypothetical protein